MELRGLGLYNDISGQDPEECCVAQWLFFQSSELCCLFNVYTVSDVSPKIPLKI